MASCGAITHPLTMADSACNLYVGIVVFPLGSSKRTSELRSGWEDERSGSTTNNPSRVVWGTVRFEQVGKVREKEESMRCNPRLTSAHWLLFRAS